MADKKSKRLGKLARELNVGVSTIVEFLHKKGVEIDTNPNSKVDPDHVDLLYKQYKADITLKKETDKISSLRKKEKKKTISLRDMDNDEDISEEKPIDEETDSVVHIQDLSVKEVVSKKKKEEPEVFKSEISKIPEPKIVGKIGDLEKEEEDSKVNSEKEEIVEKEKQEKQEKQEKSKVEAKELEQKDESLVPKNDESVKEEFTNIEEEKPAQKKKDDLVEKKVDKEKLEDKKSEPKEKEEEKAEEKLEKELENKNKENLDIELVENSKPKVVKKKITIVKDKKEDNETVEKAEKNEEQKSKKEVDVYRTKVEQLSGPTVVGKIDLPAEQKKKQGDNKRKKRKRKRIKKDQHVNINNFKENKPVVEKNKDKAKVQKRDHTNKEHVNKEHNKNRRRTKRQIIVKKDVNEEDVQKKVKETLARLQAKGKNKSNKFKKQKKENIERKHQEELAKQEREKSILKVTEFITVNELANMMEMPATQVISTCMSLGAMVGINQRLEADLLTLVAEEFGYEVEFISIDAKEDVIIEEDTPEELMSRAPIVTVMGHVDHGKTSFLDYVRSANVIAGEAGGITQHIGAYRVTLKNGKEITFLDTPGHQAFTAMRARGTQVTDIAIIVIAADDGIMPQTEEAISHALAAGVSIIFAITKIDKPGANPEKIKEQLANKNLLVEEWGGKYQSKDISSKTGEGIEDLLEEVLLAAEILDLKANPNRLSFGTVIESSLDKGRGYIATILVANGTLSIGDTVLAGPYYGKVKAMFNERNKKIKTAGPSHPALILGLNGAPAAGDKFNIMETEREAKEIATKREQLIREQGQRTSKHLTLDEIGRRIAIGNFKEINVIIKGDVDGSIEALADSLIKLSTDEIQVNVIHKAVGQIVESDIMLASASDAVVVGFQVRPSVAARKLAEAEGIEIRLYSIIYDAIEELKSAMEGMLSPEIKEEILGSAEIKETFKITKVGTIAGCFVSEGKILREAKVHVIRDGIVVYTGELGSLKRYKDDVKEVRSGMECGLNIEKFNDVKVGDLVEAYLEIEVKKTL